jgi:hypothetical protein
MSTKLSTNKKFIMHIGEHDITATNMVSQHLYLNISKLQIKLLRINFLKYLI